MKLQIHKINKSFQEKQILFDVSFDVSSSKAMGFLGRNGAGKTTTIRALMDVFKPDSGAFFLNGELFDATKVKVGYLPEERGLYGKEPIAQQLNYFARLKGSSKQDAKQSVAYWLDRFELSYAAKHKLETLSKGNQQKIQIAQALLNNPDIIILDEPFSGLDPVNAQVLKDVIHEKINQDKIVIFSSHQMAYVEEFCDEIALIDKGKIILTGDLNDIKQKLGNNRIRLLASNYANDELSELLKTQQFTKDCFFDKESAIIELNQSLTNNAFLEKLLQMNIDVLKFSPYYPSLQEIFVKEVGAHHETD